MKLAAYGVGNRSRGGDKEWLNRLMLGFYLKVSGPRAWCLSSAPEASRRKNFSHASFGFEDEPTCWYGWDSPRAGAPAQTGSRKGCKKEYLVGILERLIILNTFFSDWNIALQCRVGFCSQRRSPVCIHVSPQPLEPASYPTPHPTV